jgi:hypothetical protein
MGIHSIHGHRSPYSELDLLSMVSRELRGRTTSYGESDLTKAMLRTGHAVLAQQPAGVDVAPTEASSLEAPTPAVTVDSAPDVAEAEPRIQIDRPVGDHSAKPRRKRKTKSIESKPTIPALIKGTADSLKGKSWQ